MGRMDPDRDVLLLVARDVAARFAIAPGRVPSFLRMGSWIGGDRDGNPNVTAEVTKKACLLSRWMAADLYLRDIEDLRIDLSVARGTPELEKQRLV